MIQDRAIVTMADSKSYNVVYPMVPFSMILNDPYQDFKLTPLFDVEYVRNGARYRYNHNGTVLLKGVISNDLE